MVGAGHYAALAAPLLRPEAQSDILDLARHRRQNLAVGYMRRGTALDALRADLSALPPICAHRLARRPCWLILKVESTRRFSRVLLDAPARPPAQFAGTLICLCTAAAVTLKKAHLQSTLWSGRLTQQLTRLFTACSLERRGEGVAVSRQP